jgi:putative salt-induced outer membrane protein YdiY
MRIATTVVRAAAITVISLAALAEAQAGIVNVQSSLATEAREGLSGSIEGSLDWRTGNLSQLSIALAPVARYRSGDHLFVALGSAELYQTQGIAFDRRLFEHLRYRYTINCWLTGEAFAQHEFNERRRLQLRALTGAGPRFQLADTRRFRVGLGVAYMIEYEELDGPADEPVTDAGDTVLNHRISSYLTGSYEIDKNLLLVGTFYGQPRITDVADIRLLLETQVVVKVTDRLSFKSSFSMYYDREPPDTVEPLDTRLQSAVSYSF